MDFYDAVRTACAKRGTTITKALADIGRASGNTGSWKAGSLPKVDIVIELAQHLHMTLDELVYGDTSHARMLTQEEIEWLDILNRVPEDRRTMCKAFLETHAVVPEKYIDKKNA
jgi:hypothetical protein